MRDYRGSGGFTLRQRRRVPRGLVLLLVVILIAAAVGVVLFRGSGHSGEPASAARAGSPRPVSGMTAIPLPIPGQTPEAAPEGSGAR